MSALNHRVVVLGGRTPPFVWDELFQVPIRSVELEIGFGKGMFLRAQARQRAEAGFLGVERSAKCLGICARRLARDGRENVRIVQADAFDLLARWIPEASLSAIHILFPDPWPKKRHAKRRLLSIPLFDLAARGLRHEGLLTIATDVGWYFAEAMAGLAAHPSYERLALTEVSDEVIRTNYAIKYEAEGRPLHLARFLRNGIPPPPIPPPPSRRRRSSSTDLPPSSAAGP